MTSRHVKLNGVLLSVLLVVSMVAMGAIGAAGATAPTEEVDASIGDAVDLSPAAVGQAGEHVQTRHDPEDVHISPALEDAEGEVHVMIKVGAPDQRPGAQVDDVDVADLKTYADATQEPVLDRLEELGVDVRNTFWITNAISATVEADRVDEIAAIPGVHAIQEHVEFEIDEVDRESARTATDDLPPGGWDQLDQMNVYDAWDTTQGEDAVVAILDSGVEAEHEAIDLYTTDPSDPTYPGGWIEFSGGSPIDSEPNDAADHGTLTSSNAAGNNVGPDIGAAPEATLIHAKVGSLTIPLENVFAAMEWATEHDLDVDVMSMSFGSDDVYRDDYHEATLNAIDQGIVVVSSSGNNYEGSSGSPANDYDIHAVGATTESGDVASFSSGEVVERSLFPSTPDHWPEEWIVPDVSAPGEDTTGATGSGSEYRTASGTSFSAPLTAGVVALMRSANPDVSVDEIKTVLDETANHPDGEDAEQDIRHGHGIVDAAAAVDEVAAGVPEHDLGDVDEDGSVDVEDVIATQQYLAGIPVEDFNANLADMDRSGTPDEPDVTVGDLITIQQKVVGMVDPGQALIENVTVPDDVDQGETFNATVELSNPGEEGAIQHLNATWTGADEPSGQAVADLAPDATTDVTVEIEADRAAGTGLEIELTTDDDSETASIDVFGDFFEITEFEADDEADGLAPLEVNATIENTGNEMGTQDVEFVFDGTVEETVEDLELDAGATHEVSFTKDVSSLSQDTYEHAVQTADDAETASVDVFEANFQVSGLDAPAEAGFGETVTATATIENTGDGGGAQTVEYSVQPLTVDVAIIGVDDSDAQDMMDHLEDNLDDTIYDLHGYDSDELPDMDEYDTFVVYDIDDMGAFQDGLDDQGVVYLDNWSGFSHATAVEALADHRDGLTYEGDVLNSGTDGNELHIQQDHEVLNHIGGAGDVVPILGPTGGSYYAFWSGDAFTHLAQMSGGGEDPEDDYSLSVNDETNEVLFGNALGGSSNNPSDRTDNAWQLEANMVAWASNFAPDPIPGNDAQDSFHDSHTTELELPAGEDQTVELSYDLPEDPELSVDYVNRIFTDDDLAQSPFSFDYDTGDVTGQVTDERTGDPIEGVDVTVSAIDGERTATTDENGEYAVEDVAAGSATIEVDSDGYQDYSEEIEIPVDDALEHDIELTQLKGSIGGQVTATDTDDPVEGVTLELEDDRGETWTRVTDENGEYTFDGLYKGTYFVSVDDAGDNFESVIDLGAGEDVTDVDFQVDPVPSRIEGTVQHFDENGDLVPVDGATVTTADGEYQNETNADGTFVLDDVERGDYALRASHDEIDESPLYFVEVGANDVATQDMTLNTFFELSNFEAPESADPGETINASVDVTNLGDKTDSQAVFYWPPGSGSGEATADATVTLEPGETTTVTTEYTIDDDAEAGTVEHGFSGSDSIFDEIEINAQLDSVSLTIDGEGDEVNLTENDTASYTVMAHYANSDDMDVTGDEEAVSNANDTVATVNQTDGLVSAEEVGNTSIAVTYNGYTSNTVSVNVEPSPDAVESVADLRLLA